MAVFLSMVERVDTSSTLRSLMSEAPDLPIRRLPPRLDLGNIAAQAVAGSSDTPQPPAPGPADSRVPPGFWYVLSLRAHSLRLASAPDQLIAPHVLADRIQPHAYQLRVVRQVLREKMPAAILADEVGLGKTIEAGLVLKELILRDVARTVLIVAPKALLPQWQEELRERFDEDFVLTDERRFRGFEHEERVICSFQQFVSAFERIRNRQWDCLIVDEAHLLANPDSKRRRCMSELRARWRLLLTATPVQNKITDLYSLVDLAVPGRLGTLRQFVAEYVTDPATCRAVVPAKVPELRALAREVMCRTRRAETDIAFAPRRVETYLVQPGPDESALVRDVTAYLRALYRRGVEAQVQHQAQQKAHTPPRGRRKATSDASDAALPAPSDTPPRTLPLSRGALIREIVALQQSLSSSPQAIGVALRSRAEKHPDERDALHALAHRCEGLASSKERLLLEALERLGREPALIFTLRLETARRLREVIRKTKHSAECYTGALDGAERRALVERFNRGDLHALIATDAGAEGLNLQERCHVVFNYDLHWNPMKMEQRIGRVHRLGQTREVLVANFALKDSIDEYVLRLLYQKINLFTMTIGALETVLADVQEGELDVEERILDALLQHETPEEVEAAIEGLGDRMDTARQHQGESESLTMEVLG